jgi:hypothetical protein
MSGVISPPFDKVIQLASGAPSVSSNNLQIPFNPTGYRKWELVLFGVTNNGAVGYQQLQIRLNNLSTNIYIFGVERNTKGVLSTVLPAAAGNAINSFALSGSNVASVGTIVRVSGYTQDIANQVLLDIDVFGSIPQGNFLRDRITASVNLAAPISEIDLILPTEFFGAFNYRYTIMGYGKV